MTQIKIAKNKTKASCHEDYQQKKSFQLFYLRTVNFAKNPTNQTKQEMKEIKKKCLCYKILRQDEN